MDGDRKYKQRGYMDSDRGFGNQNREDRPRPQGPRPPIDITGPRLPRLVQSVTASRCFNCSTMLPADADFKTNCPKCGSPLHCCKQCSHFEPSTRFQCMKPVPLRISPKDAANLCELFSARVTVARDSAPASSSPQTRPPLAQPPRNSSDARAAFDNLFKKD